MNLPFVPAATAIFLFLWMWYLLPTSMYTEHPHVLRTASWVCCLLSLSQRLCTDLLATQPWESIHLSLSRDQGNRVWVWISAVPCKSVSISFMKKKNPCYNSRHLVEIGESVLVWHSELQERGKLPSTKSRRHGRRPEKGDFPSEESVDVFLEIRKYDILGIGQFPIWAFLLKIWKTVKKHSLSGPKAWLCRPLARTKILLHFYCFPILQDFRNSWHNVSLPQVPTPLLPHSQAPDWCGWQHGDVNDNNYDTHFSSSQVVDSLKRNILSCQKTGSIPHWMFLFLGYRG